MTTQVEQGQVLVGKYRVERVLGQGGMGVVVAARHEQLDQLVALKLLLPEALANPDVVARFFREARLASKLRGEHTARVFDVDHLDDGSPFIVMEYLEGQDLETLLGQGNTLPTASVLLYIQQACEGLAEAHAAGIVHRDLKPSNLFLTTRGDGSPCIKLLDFGISKAVDPDRNNFHTRTPTLPGTPHYMAPEQMRGSRTPDPRSDLWALGVILYELLTGEYPFRGSNIAELYVAVLNESPVPPRAWRHDIPETLERVILRCLAKNPADRFQNVAELRDALAAVAVPGNTPAARIQVSPHAATLSNNALVARALSETIDSPSPLSSTLREERKEPVLPPAAPRPSAAPQPPAPSRDPPSFDDTPRSTPLPPGRSPLRIAAIFSAVCVGALLLVLLRDPTAPSAPPTPSVSATTTTTAATTATPLVETAAIASTVAAMPTPSAPPVASSASPPAPVQTATSAVRKPRTAAPRTKAPDFGGRQ